MTIAARALQATPVQACLQCQLHRLTRFRPQAQPLRPAELRQQLRLRQLAAAARPRQGQQDAAAPDSLRDIPPPGQATDHADPDALREKETDAEQNTIGIRFMLALVAIYKQGISPLLPGSCRFLPTCSTYAADAFQHHGVLRGCVLTALRILRCNPLGPSGYDPVPTDWPFKIL